MHVSQRDVEEGMSEPALGLGAYSRARPAALPRVPEQRHGDAAAHDDVMDSSTIEEMMLGGSDEEQHPQVTLLLSVSHVTVTSQISQMCGALVLLCTMLSTSCSTCSFSRSPVVQLTEATS